MSYNQNIIAKEKIAHQKCIDRITADIKEYVNENGNDCSSWLLAVKLDLRYHTGAWNALNEVARKLEG